MPPGRLLDILCFIWDANEMNQSINQSIQIRIAAMRRANEHCSMISILVLIWELRIHREQAALKGFNFLLIDIQLNFYFNQSSDVLPNLRFKSSTLTKVLKLCYFNQGSEVILQLKFYYFNQSCQAAWLLVVFGLESWVWSGQAPEL
jgi:hypothetical protein